MLACTPVLLDGTRGPRIFAASLDVSASLPAARVRQIHGACHEGALLQPEIEYRGGSRGECRQKWWVGAYLYPFSNHA